jgi:hypothetical protein
VILTRNAFEQRRARPRIGAFRGVDLCGRGVEREALERCHYRGGLLPGRRVCGPDRIGKIGAHGQSLSWPGRRVSAAGGGVAVRAPREVGSPGGRRGRSARVRSTYVSRARAPHRGWAVSAASGPSGPPRAGAPAAGGAAAALARARGSARERPDRVGALRGSGDRARARVGRGGGRRPRARASPRGGPAVRRRPVARARGGGA